MSFPRISPRWLGELLKPDCCDQCMFHKVQLRFRFPFQLPMPGLMNNMDRMEKRIVLAHLDVHGRVPQWLKPLGCTEAVDFPAKLATDFPEYELTLSGMPDALFRKANGRLILVDYKTARTKQAGDPFRPVYEGQLLGYTRLLEETKIGDVETAALVYFENQLKEAQEAPLDLLTKDGFNVPFKVTIHEVEIDRTKLEPLLKRLRDLMDMKNPPKGREGCPDCAVLQKLFDDEVSRRGREDAMRARDNFGRHLWLEREATRNQLRAQWWQDEDDEAELASDFLDVVPGPMDL